ncbi:uncharacterized [Tachysurus ichikawai]
MQPLVFRYQRCITTSPLIDVKKAANIEQKDGVVQSEPEYCGSPAAAGDQKDRITPPDESPRQLHKKGNMQVSICLSQ